MATSQGFVATFLSETFGPMEMNILCAAPPGLNHLFQLTQAYGFAFARLSLG
jgi:hypothetical protein